MSREFCTYINYSLDGVEKWYVWKWNSMSKDVLSDKGSSATNRQVYQHYGVEEGSEKRSKRVRGRYSKRDEERARKSKSEQEKKIKRERERGRESEREIERES